MSSAEISLRPQSKFNSMEQRNNTTNDVTNTKNVNENNVNNHNGGHNHNNTSGTSSSTTNVHNVNANNNGNNNNASQFRYSRDSMLLIYNQMVDLPTLPTLTNVYPTILSDVALTPNLLLPFDFDEWNAMALAAHSNSTNARNNANNHANLNNPNNGHNVAGGTAGGGANNNNVHGNHTNNTTNNANAQGRKDNGAGGQPRKWSSNSLEDKDDQGSKWERGKKVIESSTSGNDDGDLWDDVDQNTSTQFEGLDLGLVDMSKAAEDFQLEMIKMRQREGGVDLSKPRGNGTVVSETKQTPQATKVGPISLNHLIPTLDKKADKPSAETAQDSFFNFSSSQNVEVNRQQHAPKASPAWGKNTTAQLSPVIPEMSRLVPQDPDWFYLDPQGNQQGPFKATEMRDWFDAGYFKSDLPVRSSESASFASLASTFNDSVKPFSYASVNTMSSDIHLQKEAAEKMQRERIEAERRKRQEEQVVIDARKEQERFQIEQNNRRLQYEQQKQLDMRLAQQQFQQQQRILRDLEEKEAAQVQAAQVQAAQAQAAQAQAAQAQAAQAQAVHAAAAQQQQANATSSHWQQGGLGQNILFGSSSPMGSLFSHQNNTNTFGVDNSNVTPTPSSLSSWTNQGHTTATTPAGSPPSVPVTAPSTTTWGAASSGASDKKEGKKKVAVQSMKDIQMEEKLRMKAKQLEKNATNAASSANARAQQQQQNEDMGAKLKMMLGVGGAYTSSEPTPQASTKPAGWNKSAIPNPSVAGTKTKTLREILAEEERMNASRVNATGGVKPVSRWSSVVAGGNPNPNIPTPTASPVVVAPSVVTKIVEEDASFWSTGIEEKKTVSKPKVNNVPHGNGLNDNGKNKNAFGAKPLPRDFVSWCGTQLKKINGSDDLTLLQFCSSLDDPVEIREYIAAYLGSTPAVSAFATEFIQRKKSSGHHGGNNMATASTRPNQISTAHPSSVAQNGHTTPLNKKGKKGKKNKGKGIDASSLLGYSVSGNSNRPNQGEIDYGS